MHIFDISFFGLQIAPTWYGLMYALGFSICYTFFRISSGMLIKDIDDLLYYIFFGVIFGGRMGYVVLYNFSYFLQNPIEILSIWKGGMSFHGGLIGVIFCIFLFTKIRKKYRFFDITDTLAAIIPIALGLGRIGNYINGELVGYMGYEGLFAMKIDTVPYFPSPLLEMFLEGILLFLSTFFVWRWTKKNKSSKKSYTGLISGIFLIGYSVAREVAEIFRLPDVQIGYLFGTNLVTLGMVYTLPMLLVGLWIANRSISPSSFVLGKGVR